MSYKSYGPNYRTYPGETPPVIALQTIDRDVFLNEVATFDVGVFHPQPDILITWWFEVELNGTFQILETGSYTNPGIIEIIGATITITQDLIDNLTGGYRFCVAPYNPPNIDLLVYSDIGDINVIPSTLPIIVQQPIDQYANSGESPAFITSFDHDTPGAAVFYFYQTRTDGGTWIDGPLNSDTFGLIPIISSYSYLTQPGVLQEILSLIHI